MRDEDEIKAIREEAVNWAMFLLALKVKDGLPRDMAEMDIDDDDEIMARQMIGGAISKGNHNFKRELKYVSDVITEKYRGAPSDVASRAIDATEALVAELLEPWVK